VSLCNYVCSYIKWRTVKQGVKTQYFNTHLESVLCIQWILLSLAKAGWWKVDCNFFQNYPKYFHAYMCTLFQVNSKFINTAWILKTLRQNQVILKWNKNKQAYKTVLVCHSLSEKIKWNFYLLKFNSLGVKYWKFVPCGMLIKFLFSNSLNFFRLSPVFHDIYWFFEIKLHSGCSSK
jgi:hypothetical protein